MSGLFDPKPPLEGADEPVVWQNDEPDEAAGEGESDLSAEWLAFAKATFEASTDFLDANYRRQWERNVSNFQSKHPPGSKYYTGEYKHRSKLFRPKTRSAERNLEAGVMRAVFATPDVVTLEPLDPNNALHIVASEVQKALLEYRLETTVPWFQVVIGGAQDANVYSVVISRQGWAYEEMEVEYEIHDERGPVIDQTGKVSVEKSTEVVRDTLYSELIAPENLRIDPGAKWYDPINTSPYVIDMMPMHIEDVLTRMMRGGNDKTGEPGWRKLTASQLRSTRDQQWDPTRQERERSREDPLGDTHNRPSEYEIVWVHQNIVRRGGIDWIFWTAGTEYMLTDPVPLLQVYEWLKPGERPYAMGAAVIEAHKTYPAAPVELWQDLQGEANTIANQRIDNVQLAMNKRYRVRRGATIDYEAMRRSTPGGAYEVDDIEKDVFLEETHDVTASSFEEQIVINADFDELAGQFSASSVNTNRQMNETVGGMSMARQDASSQGDYIVRTVVETWLRTVVRQLVRLIQMYESDETALAVAQNRASVLKRHGYERITEDMLVQELLVKVDVGIFGSDPQRRMTGLQAAIQTCMLAAQLPHLNQNEITKEAFGAAGHPNGGKFYNEFEDKDPRVAQLEQLVSELQQALDTKQIEQQGKERITAMQLQDKERERQHKAQVAEAERRLKARIAVLNHEIQREGNMVKRGELTLEREALLNTMISGEFDRIMQAAGMAQGGEDPEMKRGGDVGVMQRNDYGKVAYAEG